MSTKLPQNKIKIFHNFVIKCVFLCKQARQNMLPGIGFLATIVKKPNKSNWKKLLRIMDYLQATKEDIARVSTDNMQTIKWYIIHLLLCTRT